MSIRIAWRTFPVVALLLLSGCVLVPALEPNKAKVTAYSENPTLTNAVAVAESLRSNYTKEVKDQIVTERVMAIGLIAATTVAADMAIRDVSKHDVLGLALGTGATYTATNFLVSKPQQYIYAAGANAVQCALDTVHPMRVAFLKRSRLETLIKEIDTASRDLETELATITKLDPDLIEGQRASAVMQEAKGIKALATDALIAMDNAGGDLYSALGRIQNQVTQAISANSPNLQSLMQQLGSALPALGSQITGVVLPAVPEMKAKGTAKTATSPSAVKSLLAATKKVEELDAEAQLIIAAVQAKPNAESLKACSVDLAQAGLTMKVTPSDEVAVPSGKAATFSVSGGVLPYQRATWIGSAPSIDEVQLTTETGAGLVTIVVNAGAKAGKYMLLVRDSAQGRETVNVSITNSSEDAAEATDETKKTAKKAEEQCTVVPKLEEVQKKLIGLGFQNLQVTGKARILTADGCHGEITDTAMREYLTKQSGSGAPIPADALPVSREELFKTVKESLGIEEGE